MKFEKLWTLRNLQRVLYQVRQLQSTCKEVLELSPTLAGGTRPAAVICPVMNLPKWCVASMTALRNGKGAWV